MAGEQNGDFRSQLPVEYQNDGLFQNFKDVGSLAKGYKEINTFMSTTARVPKPDAKPEEFDNFYKAWGRPEKAEQYKFPDLPKEFSPDDGFKKSLSEAAHSIGLNQKQYDSLIAWGATTSKSMLEADMANVAAADKALKDEWGFRYDTNKERAVKTIASLVGYKKDDPFVTWLEGTGNDKNPIVLRFFNALADKLGEDGLVQETVSKQSATMEDAQKKIRAHMADSKGPYYNENAPNHMDIVKEVESLYKVAYPD